MSVTLKDLSKASGVSVGTVSRALNDKDEVSPGTAQRIRKLADEMGYVPNRAGRALSAQKNINTIGVLLPSINGPFFDDIKSGIEDAKKEFKDLGIDILLHEVEGWNVDVHLKHIEKLKEQGVKAMALCCPDDVRVRDAINALSNEQIPVILINNSISGCDHLCFVGPNYIKSGEIAAGLLKKMRQDEELNILIVVGLKSHHGHAQRVQGFNHELTLSENKFKVVDIVEGLDSEITTQQVTMKALKEHPEINCIYMATGSGVGGLGAAIIAADRKFFVIACDEIYTTREYVKSDLIDFVICQEPRVQGYQSIKLMHEYLSKSSVAKPHDYFVDTIIKLKNHFR